MKQKDRTEDIDGVLVGEGFRSDLFQGHVLCNAGVIDDDVNLEFARPIKRSGVSVPSFRPKVEAADVSREKTCYGPRNTSGDRSWVLNREEAL